MLITCLFSSFMGSVVAIRCHCLASHRSASSPLTFFMIPSLALRLCFLFRSCLLLCWSPPQSFIFGISHAVHTGAHNNTRMHYNFIAFFYKAWRKCTHIYVYIQTLAQIRTAVIKISCLATLSNNSAYLNAVRALAVGVTILKAYCCA